MAKKLKAVRLTVGPNDSLAIVVNGVRVALVVSNNREITVLPTTADEQEAERIEVKTSLLDD